jgi:hypothetical protein
MKTKKLWIVQEKQTEGGWGFCDFDAEVYESEAEALNRAEVLNAGKPAHCGYYFDVTPATLNP